MKAKHGSAAAGVYMKETVRPWLDERKRSATQEDRRKYGKLGAASRVRKIDPGEYTVR